MLGMHVVDPAAEGNYLAQLQRGMMSNNRMAEVLGDDVRVGQFSDIESSQGLQPGAILDRSILSASVDDDPYNAHANTALTSTTKAPPTDGHVLKRGERLFASLHRASTVGGPASDDPRGTFRDPLLDIARAESSTLSSLERKQRGFDPDTELGSGGNLSAFSTLQDKTKDMLHNRDLIARVSVLKELNVGVALTFHDIKILTQYSKPPIEVWGVGRATYVMLVFLWSLLLESGIFSDTNVQQLTEHIDSKLREEADTKVSLTLTLTRTVTLTLTLTLTQP